MHPCRRFVQEAQPNNDTERLFYRLTFLTQFCLAFALPLAIRAKLPSLKLPNLHIHTLALHYFKVDLQT
jgi:hypothetical protein